MYPPRLRCVLQTWRATERPDYAAPPNSANEGSRPTRGRLRFRVRLVSGAVLLALLIHAPRAGAALPNGVAAGDVTPTSAVLWTHSTVLGPVLFEYTTDRRFRVILGDTTATVTDALQPVKVEIDGLTPGTQYYYRATDATGRSAQGRFRTPAVGIHAGLRFGVSGDWRGELSPYPAISNIPGRDLDFFVALGDTIYADYSSPDLPIPQAETLDDFRIKNNEVYSRRFGQASWARARASTALLACIDDHEVTNDFAGGAPPASDPRFDLTGNYINETILFQNGLQAFHEYNPIREEFYGATGDPRTAGKRKLYRYRTDGLDAAVFVLDARSFRDEELAPISDPTDPAEVDAFIAESFDSSRTMLGPAQLQDLKDDLLVANAAGVTWKFILVPEPIQNLGPFVPQDRYEGYAYERTELLQFIDDNDVDNVVFIAADVHGTLVNNLTYQVGPGQPQIPMAAFEITTGPVAFDAPFGPTVFQFAEDYGFVSPVLGFLYNLAGRRGKDSLILAAGNALISDFGYDPIGLDDSPIDAELLVGTYVSVNAYGWTEFDVDADTQQLTVTTYGIDWYTEDELLAQPWLVSNRPPRIFSQFVVYPAPGDGG